WQHRVRHVVFGLNAGERFAREEVPDVLVCVAGAFGLALLGYRRLVEREEPAAALFQLELAEPELARPACFDDHRAQRVEDASVLGLRAPGRRGERRRRGVLARAPA